MATPEGKTAIEVSREFHSWLFYKKEPGDSFEDVVRREIGVEEVDPDADGENEERRQ